MAASFVGPRRLKLRITHSANPPYTC